MLKIRHAGPADADAIWAILEPVIRAGETYTLPRDMGHDDALAYWFSKDHEVFVAEEQTTHAPVIGTTTSGRTTQVEAHTSQTAVT